MLRLLTLLHISLPLFVARLVSHIVVGFPTCLRYSKSYRSRVLFYVTLSHLGLVSCSPPTPTPSLLCFSFFFFSDLSGSPWSSTS